MSQDPFVDKIKIAKHEAGQRNTVRFLQELGMAILDIDEPTYKFMIDGTEPKDDRAKEALRARSRQALVQVKLTLSESSKAVIFHQKAYIDAKQDLHKFYLLLVERFKSEDPQAKFRAWNECLEDLTHIKQGQDEPTAEYVGRGSQLQRESKEFGTEFYDHMVAHCLIIGVDQARFSRATHEIRKGLAYYPSMDDASEFIEARISEEKVLPVQQADETVYAADDDPETDGEECLLAESKSRYRQQQGQRPAQRQETRSPQQSPHRPSPRSPQANKDMSLYCSYCAKQPGIEENQCYGHTIHKCRRRLKAESEDDLLAAQPKHKHNYKGYGARN